MLPKQHIIIGFIVSLLLFICFPEITLLYTIIIFLSSVLIDFDHYLYYVIKKKDMHLGRAYKWWLGRRVAYTHMSKVERDSYKKVLMIFHGIEFWIILLLLVFINKIFLFVLIGISIHMILDFIDLFIRKDSFYIKISQIYTHLKNRNKKELS